ncbi:metallophosphoesterase family protein [Labrys sp. ZIDIC5]|uniref:metallophosphoesterase family protein n=1 Tax=Labrys sedimenti TaxID=3106036 RepID=UPI002ACA9FF0|nr:metallophosphoesterase family protein [Labrys sp. ZIDIC5]MDZ5454251.1 metallophosphoesterase family protein [Labrys sp. ZIDIC5]
MVALPKGEGVSTVPPGTRIYAVGDIHGRRDLLLRMEQRILADLGGGITEPLVVFLGDYVDRGAESAGVIEYLSSRRFGVAIKALRGNHEDLLLSFLDDPSVLDRWRRLGGLETLHSYGVDVSEALRGRGYRQAREQFAAKLPGAHRRFLEELPLNHDCGDYFFCHAGVKPRVGLDRQADEDLLWIRDEFLKFGGSFGKIVVHGHSPVSEPEMHANRINVDTGAFATSRLTAVVLEGADRRFLSATP